MVVVMSSLVGGGVTALFLTFFHGLTGTHLGFWPVVLCRLFKVLSGFTVMRTAHAY